MLTLRRSSFAGLLACAVLGTAADAPALSFETLATPFTGSDTAVRITLTEAGGDIVFTLSVEEGLADLRGVFFDIANDVLLAGLSASGEFVTGFFATGDVIDLGHGGNLHGGGTPCPCDIGVELGTPGIGKDDIQSTSFVLSHNTESLSLADFSEQLIGVRVTSVGDEDSREGSSKLRGTLPPIPEPSTALLLTLGVAGLAASRRPRR